MVTDCPLCLHQGYGLDKSSMTVNVFTTLEYSSYRVEMTQFELLQEEKKPHHRPYARNLFWMCIALIQPMLCPTTKQCDKYGNLQAKA